jgi:multisubunit Na+/H+ antiporter MnhE subunit
MKTPMASQVRKLSALFSPSTSGRSVIPSYKRKVDMQEIQRGRDNATTEMVGSSVRGKAWNRVNSKTGEAFFGMNDYAGGVTRRTASQSAVAMIAQRRDLAAWEALKPQEYEVPWWIILGNSKQRVYLDIMALLAIMYAAMITPYNSAFGSKIDVSRASLRSVIFLVDVFSQFCTSYIGEDFHPVFDQKKIAKRYLMSYFLTDFIASWPWALINGNLAFLELIRCLFLDRLAGRLLNHFQILDGPKRLASWGFVKLFMFLFVYLHWVACAWFVMAPDWYNQAIRDQPVLEQVDPYILALQASVHLTVGTSGLSTMTPATTNEARIQTFILLCGACIVAGIFGNMAALITEFSAETANYHRKISHTMTQVR